jgi:deoxyribodipyrimidine photolyase
LWLPELAKVPVEKIHRPDVLSFEEQTRFQVKLGAQYPKAAIQTAKWV